MWPVWVCLGFLVGFASARLLPDIGPPVLTTSPAAPGRTTPAPTLEPSLATPEPPTPTPEPYIPCKDDPGLVPPPPPGPEGEPANYLHTCNGALYDSRGLLAQITGINWYGIEERSYAPGGLGVRNWKTILAQIASMGFNSIRLPFSNDALRPGAAPADIDYELNPDLRGLSPLEIMDRIVAGARELGLKVILDRHRPDSSGQSSFWYTAGVTEVQWIADWRMLARRYRGNDTVIGVDLHNEPAEGLTWGTGIPGTDWKMAAERAGNAVLEENPYLLILVEGIYDYGDLFWWGGNLKGVRFAQVNLKIPNRAVYSPHDFGPGVYPQSWFSDPSFPANLEGVWDAHWGFIRKQGIAPVVVGEFGAHSTGADIEGTYQRKFVQYLKQNGIGYLYWALNPDSPDSGGLLERDWETPAGNKLELISTYQSPLIGITATASLQVRPPVITP